MVNSGDKWVIIMFMGEYHHSIDEKGRLIIPSKIREELTDEFIVTRGIDNCLFVYKTEDFKDLIRKYKELPNTKNTRNFMRFFLSGATISDFDKQGRVNISLPLINYASLEKDCVIIGVNDHLEVWSKNNWNTFIEENEADLSDIADKLFQSDLNA